MKPFPATGPHADRQNDHVGIQNGAVGQHRLLYPVLAADFGHGLAQRQFHAARAQMALDGRGELLIEVRQQLRHQLHERRVNAALCQLIRSLHADETAADHDGLLRALAQRGHDLIHVRDREDIVHTRKVAARHRGTDGFAAHGQHELVIRLLKYARGILAAYDLLLRVDTRHLMEQANIDIVTVLKQLRRHQQQAVAFRNGPAHIVGQAAVRERDILALLENDDLGIFIRAPCLCGSARSGGHAANHYYLHRLYLSKQRSARDARAEVPYDGPYPISAPRSRLHPGPRSDNARYRTAGVRSCTSGSASCPYSPRRGRRSCGSRSSVPRALPAARTG